MEEKRIYYVGIDHGNHLMKTSNHVFENGVERQAVKPTFQANTLVYDGAFYKIGEKRNSVKDSKLADDDYYLLTLAALAKECQSGNIPNGAGVVLGVGLPLKQFATVRKQFVKYLKRGNQPVHFKFEDVAYDFTIENVLAFPQCYAAVADRLGSMKGEYLIVDVGSWTIDIMHIGTLAQGKRTTVSHKVKKEIAVPECDWVVVENAHEAIISRMDFDAVQILMSRDTIAVAGKNESYMYAGILYCGDCGSSMVHRKESYKGREYINYICSNYNRNGKDACSRHCIREEDLNQIVLGELQGYTNSMCDCEKVLAHLDELNVNYDEAVAHDKEIVALKQELTKCSAFKASLYQDLRDEIISKEQFTRYREEFSAKERELEQAIREQETIIRNIYENGIVVAKDLEQFREGLVIGNLDRVALVSFIDRILIYDDFRVEIVFKYRQEMEKVTGLFDVVNEKDAEPVYTMVDGLPVLELKEAV